MGKELTICSVYHSPETYKLLELNFDFVKKLNPKSDFIWIASDGSEEGEGFKINEEKFKKIKGANTASLAEVLPNKSEEKHKNAYLHGASLNRILPYIKTRFAIFLDNDFYIARPEWIKEVVSYMRANGLAFFGSPFYPMRYQKYRYFPCAQCIFIDFQQINKASLDFRPQHANVEMASDSIFDKRLVKKVLIRAMGDRYRICKSLDTCSGLFHQYGNNKQIRYKSAVPVINLETEKQYDFASSKKVFSASNRFIEMFLPERFSYIPKKTGSYALAGFREKNFPDIRAIGWEEYLWKDAPFGFHMQATSKRFRRGYVTEEEALSKVAAVLSDILKTYGYG